MDIVSEQQDLLLFSSDCASPAMTDESLLKAAAHGDEASFCLLYERHRDVVFRFAYRLLQSVEIAEEITHDCFLSLIKKPALFDARKASLKTYLCAAARNQAYKRWNKSSPETSLEELSVEPQEAEFRSPLRQVIGAELSVIVQKAIAELPPLQREAVILFEFEDLSLAEIAEVVNADVGTVKSRLHRAREKLRMLLEPYMKG